jgi:hypothetical protein
MLVAEKFTPEVMLSAPRRSPAVPNYDGTLALYTVSTYSFADNKAKNEARVMSIESGSSNLLTGEEKIHDINWVPGTNDVIYFKSGEKGLTSIMILDGSLKSKSPYLVAEVNAPISSLKLKALENGSVAFAVAGLADEDGKLYNDQAVDNKSTARIFDDFRVRCVSIPPETRRMNRAVN